MKLSIPLIALASATSAMAGCYGSGKPYLNDCNKNSFLDAADDLCKSLTLAGYFNYRQTKKACAPARCNGIKMNYEVGWKGSSGGHTLAVEDCKRRLKENINNCPLGGTQTVADWFFK